LYCVQHNKTAAAAAHNTINFTQHQAKTHEPSQQQQQQLKLATGCKISASPVVVGITAHSQQPWLPVSTDKAQFSWWPLPSPLHTPADADRISLGFSMTSYHIMLSWRL